MYKVNIKALSVNDAWKGRRFKTDDYKAFEQALWYLLPNKNVPKGKLRAIYRFGVSSKSADGDNLIKNFQDICSKKYLFNDKMIYEWDVKKIDVEKGEESIEFEFLSVDKII